MIKGHTGVLAVIGNPIQHSLSPVIHNVMIAKLGLEYVYIPFQCKTIDAVAQLKHMSVTGFNVTIPYKETIIPYIDTLDSLAGQIGAVNTVVAKDGRWIGYNTDAPGFIFALQHMLDVSIKNKRVVLLGSGGTTRALCVAMIQEGVKEIIILNRSSEKPSQLLADLTPLLGETKLSFYLLSDPQCMEILAAADVVVNTTPVGMSPNIKQAPLDDFEWVSKSQYCVDVIYNPSETVFLKESKARGARTLNGLPMLVAQAMYSFEYFTGFKGDFAIMYNEVKKYVKK
ncbi:shikimate dehydrogenase [Candidatus Marinamargulisbacteria bacterium SCGC AG-414-C22]|nr:shikimate dehydrogenase [Candidatus Marinamargulisbacteria bacterium SCGC AG-414-C22]